MRNQTLTRREIGLFAVPVFMLGFTLLLPAINRWRMALVQDRLYVTNKFSEPLSKIRIVFWGDDGEIGASELIFRNVPSGGSQWQLFDPKCCNGPSSGRFFKIEGVTLSGKRIGNTQLFTESEVTEEILDLGLGARFYIVVQSDGVLEVHPNQHYRPK